MTYPLIDLSVFPKEREEKLKALYRYSLFETLYYRSNLWMHTHRMLWMAESLLPVASQYIDIDQNKARVLALVHDDAEMITGDFQAGVKARMTKEELRHIDDLEASAIQTLVGKYPKMIDGYTYEQLLTEALTKDSIEAQFVSYIDKLDGYCESLHELLAGNLSLVPSVFFYTWTLATFSNKFPALKNMLESKPHPLIVSITSVSSGTHVVSKELQDFKVPYTIESLDRETRFPFYNEWRKIVHERGGTEGLDWLIKQREFI